MATVMAAGPQRRRLQQLSRAVSATDAAL
eukprot:SAG22_NODE_16728_length_319_cov_0.872727_2_plen_28_part_01